MSHLKDILSSQDVVASFLVGGLIIFLALLTPVTRFIDKLWAGGMGGLAKLIDDWFEEDLPGSEAPKSEKGKKGKAKTTDEDTRIVYMGE